MGLALTQSICPVCVLFKLVKVMAAQVEYLLVNNFRSETSQEFSHCYAMLSIIKICSY